MPRPGLVQRQLLRNRREEFPHILGRLGRRFKEEKAGLLCICLGIGRLDRPLVGLFRHQVELVASEGDDDVLVGLALELLHPRLGLVEGGLRTDVRREGVGGGWGDDLQLA